MSYFDTIQFSIFGVIFLIKWLYDNVKSVKSVWRTPKIFYKILIDDEPTITL